MLSFISFLSWIYLLAEPAHEFHTSLAQIQYNTTTKSFEVSLRVFTDDLEAALTRENNNQKVSISDTKLADPFIEKYINKHLLIHTKQGHKQQMTFVGKEIEVDVTWIYVEVSATDDLGGLRIQNTILTELFDDQVNIVNLNYLRKTSTYLFKNGQTVQDVGN
ncbi:hypothetical protein GXP67_24000 [Rhodocytophaga rosea]|uniref:Peptidase E n=1 Tax=Rhodocytophaga rosea TaxID=2704465 RepID=A0A6C0GN72_9BACT|nr:DUF6702 family protein [Rhodocytophaga rosea]QHT69488.1 hypothetical protein GXP67_24000 [Rhodocytophaga rosea]